MKRDLQLSTSSNFAWRRMCLVLMANYFAFLCIDIFIPAQIQISSGLKFLSVVLLFFAQLLWGREDQSLWKFAAGLTIPTDFLLLFTSFDLFGVLLFNFVQLLRYLQRTGNQGRAPVTKTILAIIFTYFILQTLLSSLIALSITYGLLLLLNTSEAIRSGNTKLSLAYILFCACDFSVVIAFLSSGSVELVFRKLIWAFYLPSQILLADEIMEFTFDEK